MASGRGARRVGLPERFTIRAGTASSRVRMVRATVSASTGSPMVARPADEVVGQHGALQPGGVGGEVAGGAVFEPGAFFEVADGQLDAGVLTVEGVDLDGGCRQGR